MNGAELIALLEQPHDDAAWILDLRWTVPTEALLEALAAAEAPSTRAVVADLLGYRGDPAGLEPLLGVLDDTDAGVRSSVADALGKLAIQDLPLSDDANRRLGAALLARFEAERDPAVLTTLAVALGSARYAPALPALRAALDDPALVRLARDAIAWIERGPRRMLDAAHVVAALEAPQPPGTRELFDVATTATLVEALARAERPPTRRRLAELLGERSDPAGIDALLPVLDDPDPEMRAAAAEALEKILQVGMPRDEAAEQRAGAALLARFESEPVPEVRRLLAPAVGAAGYRPAEPVLRAALDSDDPDLAAAAEWGLHWLQDD